MVFRVLNNKLSLDVDRIQYFSECDHQPKRYITVTEFNHNMKQKISDLMTQDRIQTEEGLCPKQL